MFLLSWQSIFKIPDVAISTLFKFLKMMFSSLAEILKSENLMEISKNFPDTLSKALKVNYISRENFQKYVTCQQCHCTYPHEISVSRVQETDGIVRCTFVQFPRHPQRRMRSPCQSPLVKIIKTTSGRRILRPIKVFCYKSITESIGEMVQKPGMLDLFNHWKSRTIPNGIMADLYDGMVWQSFLSVDGKDLLNSRYGIGLLISVDWFQPYKHVQYSVGTIYLVVLNLPRRLRYRRENMIVVGIIPGPSEPSLHINSFLEPLVVDLLKLWKGVEIETSEGRHQFFGVLLCNSSDIPACRKVGGFVGHAAAKGCSRCLKSFVSPSHTFGDKLDYSYSGFNPDSWPQRTVNEHRIQGMSWKHATTLAERTKIEQEFGMRFTELLRLPYFDTVRYSVVDPMYNILLGTPKLMIKIWKEKGYLSSAHFEKIQSQCNGFTVPSDIGRIPYKIASGFASFTADQWKNWTLIYSLVALKNILPFTDYTCWKMYVEACSLVCSKAISLDAVNRCNDLLVSFCTGFQRLYGAEKCTPNMHLHCHIKECLVDYGPGCNFWLFACERMNGFLGSVPTNHHSIEIQLMRKLASTQQSYDLLSVYDDISVKQLLDSFEVVKGSLKYEVLPDLPITTISTANVEFVANICKLLQPVREACLCSAELECVDVVLRAIFGSTHLRTLMLHKSSHAVHFCDLLYGSLNSIHGKSALVYVKTDSGASVPAFVKKYITVTALLKEETNSRAVNVTLACINWLQPHQHKDWYGAPVEVWRVFNPSPHTDAYIPITNVLCRCAYVTETVTFGRVEETVTIVMPTNNFSGL